METIFIVQFKGETYAGSNVVDIIDFVKEQTKALKLRPKTIRTTGSSLGTEYTHAALEMILGGERFVKASVVFSHKYKIEISRGYKVDMPKEGEKS